MQSRLAMHLSPSMRSPNSAGDAVPGARDDERAMPDARRQVPRRTARATATL